MKRNVIAGIIGFSLITLMGTTAVAKAEAPIQSVTKVSYASSPFFKDVRVLTDLEMQVKQGQLQAELEKTVAQRQAAVEVAYKTQLLENNLAVETVVDQLLDYAGKTPYIFAGATPRGWDCSGMVLWMYKKLNIDLPHSASKQAELGMIVTTPQIGDIVFFDAGYGVQHSAIYLGNHMAVHAGFKPGAKTEVISLDSPAFSGNVITYKRFIDLGN